MKTLFRNWITQLVKFIFRDEKQSYDPTIWEEKESVSGIKYLWPKKI